MPRALVGWLVMLVCATLLLTGGCASNKNVVEIDPRFSMNVAKPPREFPNKKLKLTPAETEVLARRGKPDFIRIWWRKDGSLITSSDLAGKHDQVSEMMGDSKKSWVYLTDEKNGEEVLFLPNGTGYNVRPVDELIRLVCTYGDPNFRSVPVNRDGEMHETWNWIEFGLQVELVDGKEFKRTRTSATGSGTFLGK